MREAINSFSYHISMQQSQQQVLSVRHKLPQANSLLPPESLKSEPAYHLRKRVNDITATSSYDWPLDSDQMAMAAAVQEMNMKLSAYYEPEFQVSNLLRYHQERIVFLNGMVHMSDSVQQGYYFGSISVDLQNIRRSLPKLKAYSQHSNILEFDDKIQSGNLYFALQHDRYTYLLANRLDYNTRSYGQWFYFKVTNHSEETSQYRFHIINMTKNSSMFGKGLKVSVCRQGVWGKQGHDIQYVPNKFLRNRNSGGRSNLPFEPPNYYTLSFSLTISAGETLYIAYNQPYTYTCLGKMIDRLSAECPIIHRTILCRTLLGNRVQKLTISNKNFSFKDKKIIYITGRVHPIETAGSFVIQGVLEELLRPVPSLQVQKLLQNYMIKVIPMINPDGVIVGNARCNMDGYDLNRQWKNPKKQKTPQIFNLKRQILKDQGRIEMFIDLHGHSKKKNVFAYGCHDFRAPFASRQFPYLLSKVSSKGFDFTDCRFTRAVDSKKSGKQGTARISLWNKLKIPHIYTIEHSYCSSATSNLHYDHQSYCQIGRELVKTICLYFNKQTEIEERQVGLNTRLKDTLIQDLMSNPKNYEMGLKSETESQSETEQRMEDYLITKESPPKTHRSRKNIYTKSKTEKQLKSKQPNRDQYQEGRKTRRNETLEPKREQSPQLIHSISQLQSYKKKYFRNLEPLNKKQIKLNKCEGVSSSKNEQAAIKRKGQSQPLIRQTQIRKQQNKNKGISIVEIGKQQTINTSRQISESRNWNENNHRSKNEVSLHNRIKIAEANHKEKKLAHFLRLNESQRKQPLVHEIQQIPSRGLLEFYYPRHPPIKTRKNTNRMVNSKMEELLHKIKDMHHNKVSNAGHKKIE